MVVDDLKNGGKIFGTTVAKIYPFCDWKHAFD